MKRSKIDIIYDILKTVQDEEPIPPTKLLYKTNLSHGRMKTYLEELKEKKFVEFGKGKYTLLEEGHKFLQHYQQLKRFVDAFGF